MAHDIFISYSTKDKVTADAICHILEQNKMRCWIAPRNIVSGKPYAEEIMDAIKATKIVVLVFSSNSQASQFVNNEINIAFSNNKPIISFKIDESMPERELEYFLKTNHWLDAYPNPDEVFGTLVKDASRLIGDETANPIIDKNVMEKARNGEFNQISVKNEWKSLIFMFTPLYSLALIYMGISAKMKKVTVEGIICAVPLLLMIYYYFIGAQGLYNLTQVVIAQRFLIILWIVSLIYVYIIRKDYSFRKSVMNSVGDDDRLFTALVDEYGDI
ncbi:toll/interleukin-1 receptor domain-containing protein [uncultured Methanobrevibacter sp.]|uniref:toll/interleukin-1 receptor domain-containing protein n=1 Tax=uncultured Methanobrevibacter sp. TaxID=253161 RepID=UPI00261330AD|nr:toll/interleukin-1 receptor domain-containing protein [uncultured Methanobrevibacter sp.]